MDELIKQILDIEEKAQSVVADAREAERELAERVTLDSIKMQNDIETQVREKNASIDKAEVDETEARLEEISQKTKAMLSALDEKYRESRDKWINAIVSGVIGG